MQAQARLDAPYDRLVSQELVSDLVRLSRLGRSGKGTTSLVLSLDRESVPDLLDLEGLGAEVWAGEDAQAYVSRLRGEWGR